MNNNKKQLVKQLENLIEQIKNTELDLAGHSLKHNYWCVNRILDSFYRSFLYTPLA